MSLLAPSTRVPGVRRAVQLCSRALATTSQPSGSLPSARPASASPNALPAVQPPSRFARAATTTGVNAWEPHHAPQSHAPTTYATSQRYMGSGPQKTAQEYIDSVPVIEVDGVTAICDGGDPRLGHPAVFIQLNRVHEGPATCKYCGLRYQMAHH